MKLTKTCLILLCLPSLFVALPLGATNAVYRIGASGGRPTLLVDNVPTMLFSHFKAAGDLKVLTNRFSAAWRDGISHSWQIQANPWATNVSPTGGVGFPFLQKFRDFLAFDPQAQVMLRLVCSVPKSWGVSNASELFAPSNTSGYSAGISFASLAWRRDAGAQLGRFLEALKKESAPGGGTLVNHVIGGILFVGETGEWNNYREPGTPRLIDGSGAMKRAFADFLRTRYGRIESLNAAWGTGFPDFAAVGLPSESETLALTDAVFTDPVKGRVAADYFRAYSQAKADALIDFADRFKAVWPEKLCGAFWASGLWDAIGGARHQNAEGRRQSDLVLQSPSLDFICTPHAYHCMRPGLPEELQFPVDSLAANGKLGFFEFDQHLHPRPKTQRWNLGVSMHQNHITAVSESLAVVKRAFGYALAKGLGIWWWDQEGDYLDTPDGVALGDPTVFKTLAACRRVGDEALTRPRESVSEIAVIVQEDCYGLASTWAGVTKSALYHQVEELGFGAPYDVFLASDLARIKPYKLYLFLNLWKTTESFRAEIEKRKRDGAVLAWSYAPGYIQEEGILASQGVNNVKTLTGLSFTLAPNRAATSMSIVDGRHVLTEGLADPTSLRCGPLSHVPLLAPVAGTGLKVLVETEGHQGLLAVREEATHRSCFWALPGFSKALIRRLCTYAGVNLYSDHDDIVYANRSYLMVHTSSPGPRTMQFPARFDLYDALEGKKLAQNTNRYVLNEPTLTTAILRLDPR